MKNLQERYAEADRLLSRLSAAETRVLRYVLHRCADASDTVMQQIAVIYLQGMCHILKAQERLTREEAETLLAFAGMLAARPGGNGQAC